MERPRLGTGAGRISRLNGVRLPLKESRSSASFRPAGHNIAAIDFGTTYCSLVYCLKEASSTPEKPSWLGSYKLKLDNTNDRVPTAILLKPVAAAGLASHKVEIVAFGRQAREKYHALTPLEKTQHYYFHQVKMHLRNEKAIGLNYTVKAMNGKELFLVEVIALIFKFLKQRLLTEHERDVQSYKATDFDWVITVPAIWKSRGKQMMRKAAYMAGLTSDSEQHEIQRVTIVKREPKSGRLTMTPKFTYKKSHPPNPEMLSLAYEPESAAIHCMDIAKKCGKSFDEARGYMVLDIGGGTVDITVYKLNTSGDIEVTLTPQGNDWGGTRVNANFREFLGRLVKDPHFDQYISTGEPGSDAKNAADLDELMNVTFEDQKTFFGDNGVSDAQAVVRLPFKFMTTYQKALTRGVDDLGDPHVTLHDDELCISYTRMEEFFSPAIKEIERSVMESLRMCKETVTVDTVFFVGGFGGCKYLYDTLERAIKDHYNSSCTTFRPTEHQLAVVSGAIKFRQNPSIVRSRVADATYGSASSAIFNPSLHSEEYRIPGERCNHLFVPYVEKGDVIECNKLVVSKYVPGRHAQKAMVLNIYTSPERNVKYTTRPDGKPLDSVYKIGSLQVEMPDDESHHVELTFDFSHTEIQVQAYDLTAKTKATTVVDFLTDHDFK